ncbi:MAG: transposase [Anaerolineaceae bacterium]|nr:transposase [Anaerolineaceae bacterium]
MTSSKYDADKHHRRSIRLKGFDYSQPGAYFVTICTHGKECLFGNVDDGEMVLNELGRIVWEIWQSLPARYPQIKLGSAVVMPNHFHTIIEIPTDVGVIHELPLRRTGIDVNDPKIRRKMLLPKVIGYFKMNSARRINELLNTPGTPLWQRNYYDRIIRDKEEYMRIAEYIEYNPLNWQEDEEYIAG